VQYIDLYTCAYALLLLFYARKDVVIIMDFVKMSDSAVMTEIGHRIQQERLNRNLEQAVLAKQAGISRRTLQRLEAGGVCTLNSLIRILRALDKLGELNHFIPPVGFSPLQLAKLKGYERQRAGRAGYRL
jgi:DNA-binding XRE family transcriptional regulator